MSGRPRIFGVQRSVCCRLHVCDVARDLLTRDAVAHKDTVLSRLLLQVEG